MLLADKVWFKLTVWVEKIKEILPTRATIPADPIDAIKVIVEHVEDRHEQNPDTALSNVREAFHSDQYSEALSKIEILTAKIAGGEAPYIKKCLWLALLASTLPWSKEGMLVYVNRLIESEEGKKMSIENLGDRLYLAKHFLLLREKQDEYGYKVLPVDLKAGKFLQKVGDNEIPEIWKHVCDSLLREGHSYPKVQNLVAGYESYVAEKRVHSTFDTPLALTAEKKEIEETAINREFIKVASKFKGSLRQTGYLDPRQAFTYLLEQKGVGEKAIEDVWRALTSTDMEKYR